MDYCRRRVAPSGLQAHMLHCLFVQRQDQGHCSTRWAVAGIIHCSGSPTTIVFLPLKEGKRFPEFLASNTLSGSCCISGDTSTVNEVKKCLKEGEAKSAKATKKICSRQIAGPQTGQKDDGQQATDVTVLFFKQDDGQHPTAAAVDQRAFAASAPNSGSSSMKTSDSSEFETQRNAAGQMNEHLNLDDEPSLQRSPREQLSVKSASRVDNDDDDDDGFYGNRQSLVSRQKKEATARQLYNLRPAWDNNKGFNKKITQRAELRPPEGESEKLGLRQNTIKHGSEKTPANVLKLDLAEEGADGLISVFLPDTQMETQTDPASAGALTPSTDTGREAAKEPSGRRPVVRFQEIKYILLEMNVIENTRVTDIKSDKSSTQTVEDVKTTTENTEANSAAHGNIRINHIKEEKESVIPAPPLVKLFKPQTVKGDQAAALNMDRKEPTSRTDAFNQSSKWKAEGPPGTEETSTSTPSPEPGTDAEPRCVKCKTRTAASTAGKSLAGLRMREDVLEHLMKLHRSAAEDADAAQPTNRPGNGRREDDPGGNSLKCSKPSEPGHGRAAASDEPACRGLIHRTAAGWKHCEERLRAATAGQRGRPSTGAPEGPRPSGAEQERVHYSDGRLRRVQSHFYPRPGRRSSAGQRGAPGNLLSYVQRLVSENKPSGR
ncbi:uncharacterized protein LOC114867399 [Betta splendens]|uniref:Uncharacterized protein LOC114867399 n=1 Tax=Betta splendens TaxID=158456 RepID=A0A6P7P0W2_BETSP|nr:uncharacterized protein LOC114867399 [Betta splendens]